MQPDYGASASFSLALGPRLVCTFGLGFISCFFGFLFCHLHKLLNRDFLLVILLFDSES